MDSLASGRPARVGILGGTFDPIHVGHLIIAENVAWQLGLERVLFVPAGDPPHKVGRAVAPARHRVAMVERAVAGNPLFEVSDVEVERDGLSYTVDTLRQFKAGPLAGAEVFFIVGSDSLPELPTWHDPVGILEQCWLAVARRPGYDLVDLATLQPLVPNIAGRVRFVSAPLIQISSTEIRARVRASTPFRYMLPPTVYDYVRAEGLYR